MDRRLVRPTADLAFTNRGSGDPTVVLTHGAGVDQSIFTDQAAALVQRGARVITWDLRGHGQSTLADGVRFAARDLLDDLNALLTECDVSAPVLIGHSLGGNLVQAYARRHPDRVRAMIILDSSWNTGPLTPLEGLALRSAGLLLNSIPSRVLPGLLARASAESPKAIARAERLFSAMPKARFIDVWRATASFVHPEPGHRSPVPIALVRGERDRTGNIATATRRWAEAEGIVEHVIAGAGHLVTLDASEALTRTIEAIVEGWDLLPSREKPTP